MAAMASVNLKTSVVKEQVAPPEVDAVAAAPGVTVGSVFRVKAARGAIFSASVTVSVMQTVTYTQARCPSCNRLVMLVPGACDRVETRSRPTSAQCSGQGPVVVCKRCGTYVEVITHG